MSRNANIRSRALSLLLCLFIVVPSSAQRSEPFIQADVYNALYDANVQCDGDLDLSRSEFISSEFERNGSNRVSMELLKQLLEYNVQTAKQSITDKTQERELYIAEMLTTPKVSSEQSVEEAVASKALHEKIRQVDDFLKRERRYVEINECVLTTLQKLPER